jgi:tetratricopeptide (TPR) repeat protein
VNKDGIVKLHTNLGAAYILQSKYVPAKEELEQAYALYQKFKVSPITHKPLIYNLLFIYNILGDTSKRDKLFEKAYFDNLSSYYNQLISGSENILTDGYWPLQFKHVFFNY